MPDSLKGRGQPLCSPRSSRLGVGRAAYNPAPENFTKPPEIMEEAETDIIGL
jgi:hypothetical protein